MLSQTAVEAGKSNGGGADSTDGDGEDDSWLAAEDMARLRVSQRRWAEGVEQQRQRVRALTLTFTRTLTSTLTLILTLALALTQQQRRVRAMGSRIITLLCLSDSPGFHRFTRTPRSQHLRGRLWDSMGVCDYELLQTHVKVETCRNLLVNASRLNAGRARQSRRLGRLHRRPAAAAAGRAASSSGGASRAFWYSPAPVPTRQPPTADHTHSAWHA